MCKACLNAEREAAERTAEQAPDDKPGDYFVSCVNGGRYALLSGPYRNDHAAALADVDRCRKLAEAADPRAVFYAFGTVRLELDCGRVGVLQKNGVAA